MRILVSGGGSTGHVSPVLATVDALARRDNQLQTLFVGRSGAPEADVVKRAGLRWAGILGGKYRRVAGRRWWQNPADVALNLRDVILIALGAAQALWIMLRFRPQAIFNKGGTVGLPVGLAARLTGVPMVIHEPDVEPGMGNRILSHWASAIAVGFPKSHYPVFPAAKTVFTGNPVQPVMLTGDAAQGRKAVEFTHDRPVLLVVGGSQGARRLNSAVLKALAQLLEQTQVYHITGQTDLERVATTAHRQGYTPSKGYRYDPFLPVQAMADAYAMADVVVARAGANTIAELAALHKPVILVPNSQAAAHQVRNAQVLSEGDAAQVIPEDSVALASAAVALLASKPRRAAYSKAIAAFAAPDAADRIAALVAKAGGAK